MFLASLSWCYLQLLVSVGISLKSLEIITGIDCILDMVRTCVE